MRETRQLRKKKNLVGSAVTVPKDQIGASSETDENLASGQAACSNVSILRVRRCSSRCRKGSASSAVHGGDTTDQDCLSGIENFMTTRHSRRNVKATNAIDRSNSESHITVKMKKKPESNAARARHTKKTLEKGDVQRRSTRSESEGEKSGSLPGNENAAKMINAPTERRGNQLHMPRSKIKALECDFTTSDSEPYSRLRPKKNGKQPARIQKRRAYTKNKEQNARSTACSTREKGSLSSASMSSRSVDQSKSDVNFIPMASPKRRKLPTSSDEKADISSNDNHVHNQQKSEDTCQKERITILIDEGAKSAQSSDLGSRPPSPNITKKAREFGPTQCSNLKSRQRFAKGIAGHTQSQLSNTNLRKRKHVPQTSTRLSSWLRSTRPPSSISSSQDFSSDADVPTTSTMVVKPDSGVAHPISRRMKFANMHTPLHIQRISKLVESSTPCESSCSEAKCEDDLFGFENLLEPAANFLQDISPIPRPKIRRKKSLCQEKDVAKPWDGLLNVADSHLKRGRRLPRRPRRGNAKNDQPQMKVTIDESELQLFEISPVKAVDKIEIPDEYVFSQDEQRPPNKPKISKPTKHVEFNIEDALPWNEIMEHELVIETVK